MKDDDFKLLGFADKRTDKQKFVIVELLLRLKKIVRDTIQVIKIVRNIAQVLQIVRNIVLVIHSQ